MEKSKGGVDAARKMAESISDAPVSQLFLDLAAMEAEHEKVFASMRADLADQEQKPTVFDPEGEAALYLRALVDLRVFARKEKKDFILSGGTCLNKIGYERFFGQPSGLRRNQSFFIWE